MKSKTRLDSAVFQLTPTRTRYTLVINANGKTEKISSGLLEPFLAHLKAAQDQVARGCYSILLEPDPDGDAVWFTKGTVERFVRFVNTPEVLERVNMTKSEILQIDEAITIQNSDALVSNNIEDLKKKVEDNRERSLESIGGSLPIVNVVAENTILIYALGADYMNSNGPTGQESSKVQFLRVLETRKTVLQKEQVMAFERAIAAGFDMDRMVHLISFAECFGAQRLMEACLGFMVLWKEKHETDQWFENEATEAVPRQFEFYSMNNYNTMVQETKKHDEFTEAQSASNGKCDMEGNGKVINGAIADVSFYHNRDKISSGHQEFCQPLQGVPYHQNHMGGGPFFQPPYPRMEDPQFNNTESMAVKRYLMDSKDDNTESEMWERPQKGSELVKQSSQGQEKRRKAGQIGRKKSGVVVIRNINYINSERRHSRPDGGSQSTSDPENDKEAEDLQDVGPKYKQKESVGSKRSTKSKESHIRPTATGNSCDKEATAYGHEADSGNWQVFQNILLRQNNKDRYATEQGMLAQENKVQVKRQSKKGADPIVPRGRDSYEVQDGRRNDYHTYGGKKTRLLSASSDGCGSAAVNKNLCKNSLGNVTDESLILPLRPSSQDQAKAYYRAINIDAELPSELQKKESVAGRVRSQLSYEPDDLSLMPTRGTVRESIGYDPAVDYEARDCARSDVTVQKRIKEDSVTGAKEISKKSNKDMKSRVLHDNTVKGKNIKASKLTPSTEAQARAERIRSFKTDLQKMKKAKEEEEMKRLEALKRERQKRITARSSSGPAQSTLSSQTRPQLKPKLSPTLYKGSNFSGSESGQLSTLQSLPSRTASLGSSVSQKVTRNSNLNKASPSQSTLPSQMRPQPQTKLSPTSYKGSKFTDAEPGPSSPLQRLRKRAASLGSNTSPKITRPSGLNSGDQYASNKPIRSVSSLPELRKGNALVTPEMKVSAAQIRRLSDPKISNRDYISLTKGAAGVRRLTQPETSNRHQVSSSKLQNPSSLANPKATDGSGIPKLSSIITEGRRSKVAVPPDMKNRTLKRTSDMVQNKTRELTLNINGRSSVTPEATQAQQSNTKISHDRNGEEKQVIETTVVLENETPLIPVIELSGERIDTRKKSYSDHKDGENTGFVTKCAAIEARASPVSVKEVEGHLKSRFDEKLDPRQVPAGYAVKELPKCSSTGISPKPHQPPRVQALCLEDPSTTNLEYTRVPPCISEMAARSVETAKAHPSDFTDSSSLEKTPGSIVKPHVKVLSNGFRRILRFGRTTGKHNIESDRLINKGSVVKNCGASTASSGEGKKLEQNGFRRKSMSHALYIA